MGPMSGRQNRWALVIGIDNYPFFPPQRQLEGCVRDAKEMARTLAERFGFPSSQVTELLDGQATREAILAAMDRFAGRVGDGDAVVVHFSGHGSQSCRKADKRDGVVLEETIIPCDSGRGDHPNRDITAADLHGWLKELTKVTPYVTLILDCCHSGTLASHRDDKPQPRVRQVPADRLRSAPPSKWRLRDFSGGPKDFVRYVVLAACRNRESAFEITVDGRSHGALTWNLLQELASLPAGACPTYRDVFEPVSSRVRDAVNQQPQLEGHRDRELFGLEELVPLRFVPVRQRRADRVVLGAGATCGLQAGNVWKVLPPQAREGAEPVGRVEVTEVRVATATARILEEVRPGAIERWSRAVAVGEAQTGDLSTLAAEGAGGLGTWERYRKILGLRNDASELRRKLDFNLARLADGTWVPVADGDELREGDQVSFSLTNRSKVPLYLYVLDFGLTGNIEQLYPVRGVSDPLAPGCSIEVGTRPDEEIELFLPDHRDSGEMAQEEVLKAFVTTCEADLEPLFQSGARIASREARWSSGANGFPGEDWTTIERRFSLKPSGFGRRGGDVTI